MVYFTKSSGVAVFCILAGADAVRVKPEIKSPVQAPMDPAKEKELIDLMGVDQFIFNKGKYLLRNIPAVDSDASDVDFQQQAQLPESFSIKSLYHAETKQLRKKWAMMQSDWDTFTWENYGINGEDALANMYFTTFVDSLTTTLGVACIGGVSGEANYLWNKTSNQPGFVVKVIKNSAELEKGLMRRLLQNVPQDKDAGKSLGEHFTAESALAPLLAVFEIDFNQEKRLVVITPDVALEQNPNNFSVQADVDKAADKIKGLPVFDIKGIFGDDKETFGVRMRPFSGARGGRWWDSQRDNVDKSLQMTLKHTLNVQQLINPTAQFDKQTSQVTTFMITLAKDVAWLKKRGVTDYSLLVHFYTDGTSIKFRCSIIDYTMHVSDNHMPEAKRNRHDPASWVSRKQKIALSDAFNLRHDVQTSDVYASRFMRGMHAISRGKLEVLGSERFEPVEYTLVQSAPEQVLSSAEPDENSPTDEVHLDRNDAGIDDFDQRRQARRDLTSPESSDSPSFQPTRRASSMSQELPSLPPIGPHANRLIAPPTSVGDGQPICCGWRSWFAKWFDFEPPSSWNMGDKQAIDDDE